MMDTITGTLAVGTVVRVLCPGGAATGGACDATSSRATVACVSEDDSTVDVVYQDAEWTHGMEEESVDQDRVMLLQPFETGLASGDELYADDPLVLKGEAAQLWSLGDYGAALQRYQQALKRIAPPIVTGTTVLVTPGPQKKDVPLRHGTVASLNTGTVDVIYDDDGLEPEEEDDVSMERVMGVRDGDGMEQAKLCLNCARCLLKSPAGRTQEAVHMSSLAIALQSAASDQEGEGVEEQKGVGYSLLSSAYQVRASGLMRAGHFAKARKDAARLAGLPGMHSRALQLRGEIEEGEKKRKRDNKRLAKSVCQWVETSMQSNEARQQPSESQQHQQQQHEHQQHEQCQDTQAASGGGASCCSS